jgi:hypothetical protein
LNKQGAFEKEGQRFTLKVHIVEEVGLNSVRVEGKHQKFNLFEVLKVSPLSQDIDITEQISEYVNVKVLSPIEDKVKDQESNGFIGTIKTTIPLMLVLVNLLNPRGHYFYPVIEFCIQISQSPLT